MPVRLSGHSTLSLSDARVAESPNYLFSRKFECSECDMWQAILSIFILAAIFIVGIYLQQRSFQKRSIL